MATTLERLLKRDRAIVIVGLISVIALSWVYILMGAGMNITAFEMTEISGPFGDAQPMKMDPNEAASIQSGESGMPSMAMKAIAPADWTPGYAMLMVFMWWIMMVAMMLPSAAPMILLYAVINRRQRQYEETFIPTGIFTAGYIMAWGVFSIAATGLQWLLQQSELFSASMASTSVMLGGILLVAAGIWQLTPMKHACLRYCRTPLHFLSHHWRDGRIGALRMGVEHGAFCLGCCWVLMGLLFYGGVMNLYWIIGLAIFILLEKAIPAGHRLGLIIGVGFTAWGGTLIWIASLSP